MRTPSMPPDPSTPPDSATSPDIQATSLSLPLAARRLKGKIPSLPKTQRDAINNLLLDGATYAVVIQRRFLGKLLKLRVGDSRDASSTRCRSDDVIRTTKVRLQNSSDFFKSPLSHWFCGRSVQVPTMREGLARAVQ